jgi:hypothetical protein
MKTILKTLCLLAFILNMSSCKKGENDPFISLQSRKARINGNWKLKEGTSRSYYEYKDGTRMETETYIESFTSSAFEKEVYSGSSLVYQSQGTYSSKIEFKKDGSFTWKILEDGFAYSRSGSWNFNSGVGEAKSKELLVLTVLERDQTKITTNQITEIFKIKELRSNKLVLTNLVEESDGTDYRYFKSKYEEEFVFEQ